MLKLALIKRQAPATGYQALASTLVTESLFDSFVGTVAIGTGIAVGWTTINGSFGSVLAPLAAQPGLVGLIMLGILAGCLIAWRLLRERLWAFALEARRGFAIFAHPRCYLQRVVSWQLAAFTLRLGSIACFLAAFGLPVSPQSALLVLAIQSASTLVPLTANGAGTQQAMLLLALGSATTTASVVGFGAGAQLTTAAADIVLALVSLAVMTGSLRWRRMLRTGKDQSPALPASE